MIFNQLQLEKLTQEDFTIFKSWINNQEELFQFAGPIFTFPLTDEQLLKYIHDPQRIVCKLIESASNELIGNAELNFENPLPRLSRIIIGNRHYRNKGLGKILVHKMLEKLFSEYDFQKADLNVIDWNVPAIKCYESVGFRINPEITFKHKHGDVIWNVLNMTITKEVWLDMKNQISL